MFHSQHKLTRTDVLAACQNYKTVQGKKKRKDKACGGSRGGKEGKRKHGSRSMLRFCTFVSPEVNTSVRNQRFWKVIQPLQIRRRAICTTGWSSPQRLQARAGLSDPRVSLEYLHQGSNQLAQELGFWLGTCVLLPESHFGPSPLMSYHHSDGLFCFRADEESLWGCPMLINSF